jgi:pimeloyl-ACP methyl ester carboxylesterase
VPIDRESPHGEHFNLGLVKLPAAATNSTSPKVGALFVDPGGPGGLASGLVDTITLGAIQSEFFLSSFDIIGLDPPGVGLSHKVRCDMSVYAESVSSYSQSHEELARLLD